MPNRRKKTYATQKEEQDERRALENATAQAAMQPKVVESERNVEIQATSKVGNAEAEVILAKGQSTAEAYRLEVEAMGKDVFGQIRVVEKITSGSLKLIPENSEYKNWCLSDEIIIDRPNIVIQSYDMSKAKEMISARLDEDALFKLSYISESIHCNSRSEAVKTAINMAYDNLVGTKKNWKKSLLDSGFIGCGESKFNDTSNNYKSVIAESIDQKWS